MIKSEKLYKRVKKDLFFVRSLEQSRVLPLFFDWLTKVYERVKEDLPKMTVYTLSDHPLFMPGEIGARKGVEGIKFIIITNNNKTFLTSLTNKNVS